MTTAINLKVRKSVGCLGSSVVQNPPAIARDAGGESFDPWFRKVPWRKKWQPAPVLLSDLVAIP